MNNYQKALKKIECEKKKGPICSCIIPGPTGPQGPATINVGKTHTINSNEDAIVKNTGTIENAILEFFIPKGNSDKISVGKTQTIEGSANVVDNYDGYVHTLDFYIPKGEMGPTGPKGNDLIEASYLATFVDNYPTLGLKVAPNESIPITRIEITTSNICSLNNNIIKFNKLGHYKISFKVVAYTKTDTNFNPNEDFVALAFKPKDSDNIYIGASIFTPNDDAKELYAQGILSITSKDTEYSIVNLGKKDIYLKTPDLKDISSKSYFTNSPVTIIIEYLGSAK